MAVDSQGIPVLLHNEFGKGHILLFTSPSLSMIPGEKRENSARNRFVEDVINKVCSYKPLPVDISPKNHNIEFLISKTGDGKGIIFAMNHGPKDWEGDIIVSLKEANLSLERDYRVTGKIIKGYDRIKKISLKTARKGNSFIIKGILLQGDKGQFCSYRQASFAYLRLK